MAILGLSVRICHNFFPNALLAICNPATSEIRYYLLYLKRYPLILYLQMQRVHSQYTELRFALRFRIFCIFQYIAWNRITLLNAYYSVNALKASITR